MEQARVLAERSAAALAGSPEAGDHQRISQLYQFALGRKPTIEEIADAAGFVASGASADEAAQVAAQPRWQYGWGAHDLLSDRVEFNPFPHFAEGAWKGGATLPDPQLGWATLDVNGGHPGDAGHAVIRRFVVPRSGTLRVEGEIRHPHEQGNGVVARVVSGVRGRVGQWAVAHGASPAIVESIPVSAGDTIDLIVDSAGDTGYDGFEWNATLRLSRDDGVVESWSTLDGIDGPQQPATPQLDRWSQLAQVLLMCNEFAFVD
jgi:hypothetical protein